MAESAHPSHKRYPPELNTASTAKAETTAAPHRTVRTPGLIARGRSRASRCSFQHLDPASEQPAVGAAMRLGRHEPTLDRDPDRKLCLAPQRGHVELARHAWLECHGRTPRRGLEPHHLRRLRAPVERQLYPGLTTKCLGRRKRGEQGGPSADPESVSLRVDLVAVEGDDDVLVRG